MKLSKEDLDELIKIFHEAQLAQEMLIDAFFSPAGSWDTYKAKMNELGKKYGFDPSIVKGIMPDGEIWL